VGAWKLKGRYAENTEREAEVTEKGAEAGQLKHGWDERWLGGVGRRQCNRDSRPALSGLLPLTSIDNSAVPKRA